MSAADSNRPAIGVLAVQGAFAEHLAMLDRLKADGFEIRCSSDLERPMDGLILPGGESTVMGRLLRELRLFGPLQSMIRGGLPVFGTCAGLILLARQISNDPAVYFGEMDITAVRNAYGRQLGSFSTTAEFEGLGEFPMVFIRAPYIAAAGPGVRVLAAVDGHIVAAREKNRLVTAFHPELTGDVRVHELFLRMVRGEG